MAEPRLALAPERFVPATWALVVVLVAVHVVTAWVGHEARHLTWTEGLFLERGAGFRIFVGGQHTSRLVRGETWRLATSVLLHGDGLHLLMNAVAVLALGRVLEPVVGAARLLGWFVIGGVLGSVGSWFLGVLASDGASGGGFALLAAGVWLGLRHRQEWAPEDRRLMGPILTVFLVLNLVLGCVIPGIDSVGHAAGMLAGFVLAAIDPVREGPVWKWVYGGATVAFVLTCVLGWATLL